MEINITRFYNEAAPMDYSASIAEIGSDAGPSTWRAALDDAPDYNMLDTDDKREAFRTYIRGFGAWEDEEITAWSDIELNALFIQMVSGDMREANLSANATDAEWAAYETRANEGRCSGRINRTSDNHVVYDIGD